jgi:hypothetical protein
MYWNYRLLRAERGGETTTAVVEVYYGEDGTLMGYTDPVTAESYEGEDIAELLRKMLVATDKPVLTPDDFIPPK